MKLKAIFIMVLFCQVGFSQTVFGKWKTIDDETGKEKGIVEIFEKGGKVFGKIIDILDVEHKHNKCEKCEGEDKNKPILGMIILKDLTREGNGYDNGIITDPKNGKTYRCKMKLAGKDKLVVRGYIGISLLGRSQTWIRLK
jgi:uncharacterized protein (DUF2147 family)